jgi:hypothetical protein
VTSPALGTVSGETASERRLRDFTPEEYLTHPHSCLLAVIGDSEGWRFPTARISVPIAHIRVEQFFDLSQDSGDRPMVEAIVATKQTEIRVFWVNEGVTGIASFDETTFEAWSEAFRRTGHCGAVAREHRGAQVGAVGGVASGSAPSGLPPPYR